MKSRNEIATFAIFMDHIIFQQEATFSAGIPSYTKVLPLNKMVNWVGTVAFSPDAGIGLKKRRGKSTHRYKKYL